MTLLPTPDVIFRCRESGEDWEVVGYTGGRSFVIVREAGERVAHDFVVALDSLSLRDLLALRALIDEAVTETFRS